MTMYTSITKGKGGKLKGADSPIHSRHDPRPFGKKKSFNTSVEATVQITEGISSGDFLAQQTKHDSYRHLVTLLQKLNREKHQQEAVTEEMLLMTPTGKYSNEVLIVKHMTYVSCCNIFRPLYRRLEQPDRTSIPTASNAV